MGGGKQLVNEFVWMDGRIETERGDEELNLRLEQQKTESHGESWPSTTWFRLPEFKYLVLFIHTIVNTRMTILQ